MAASRSTEPHPLRRLGNDFRGLGPNERIAVTGAAVMVGSLFLPWYESPISNDLVLTGIGAFGWAEAALVLIAGATTFLALQGGGGYVPPRPLREWGVFVAAGSWAALIGLGVGAEIDVLGYLIPRYCGRVAYAKLYGILLAAFQLGGGIGAAALGIIRTSQGEYTNGLWAIAVSTTLAIIVISRLGPYQFQVRKRESA